MTCCNMAPIRHNAVALQTAVLFGRTITSIIVRILPLFRLHQTFLYFQFECCGVGDEGYKAWEGNIYFNCSSPGFEACSVPYSCCKDPFTFDSEVANTRCGADMLDPAKTVRCLFLECSILMLLSCILFE